MISMPGIKKLDFKRRRQALTNYRKRLAIAKGEFTRVVTRRTNRRIIGQAIKYGDKGDIVLASTTSDELKKLGWPSRSNRPTAYLTGLLLAKKIKEKQLGPGEFVLDIGLSSPVKDSIPFVFAKGCMDGGLKMRSGIDIKEDIYSYSNIEYAKSLKEKDEKAYEKQYSGYLKSKISVESLNALFKETKAKIVVK